MSMIENCSVTDNLISKSVRDQHRDLFVEILNDTGKNQSVNDRMLQEILSLRQERDKATQYWQIAEGRCDALQKDADRYRWLRMHTDWFDWDIVVQPHLPADHPAHDYFEVKIDCVIDFVMGNLK